MKNTCISCGMPLDKSENIGTKIDDGTLCVHCTNPNGRAKTCEEIFEGGVQFFLNSVPGANREMAEHLTRKNMNKRPYWRGKNKDCLHGDEASNEELRMALSKF